jgi:hypothetical protein
MTRFRAIEIHHLRRNFLRRKDKAPVGDTDQGFVVKTWKAAPPSS